MGLLVMRAVLGVWAWPWLLLVVGLCLERDGGLEPGGLRPLHPRSLLYQSTAQGLMGGAPLVREP
jgi:hypothetical protein